jgi:SPP1 family predicted phage head-tail adaptor
MARGWLLGSSPTARKRVAAIGKASDMAQQYPTVNPARLRHEISLATVSTTQDSFGAPITTWSAYLTTYAEIYQLSGQELYQGEEWSSNAQFRITIRYPNLNIVNVGDRIVFIDPGTNVTHTYVVQIVNDVYKRNIVLQLDCLEIDGSS